MIRNREPIGTELPDVFRFAQNGYKAFFTMEYFPLYHFKVPHHCSQAVLMTATCMTLQRLGIAYEEPPKGLKLTNKCGENFVELQQRCEN